MNATDQSEHLLLRGVEWKGRLWQPLPLSLKMPLTPQEAEKPQPFRLLVGVQAGAHGDLVVLCSYTVSS